VLDHGLRPRSSRAGTWTWSASTPVRPASWA